MPSLWKTILSDLRVPIERDPAANGALDVVLSYPGFHALASYRLIHELYRMGIPLLPRFLSHLVRCSTGIEIHPAATIGDRLFIDHGMGVVVGATAIVGNDVTLYQGVTLGGTSLDRGKKRHPTICDNVTIGVGAAVLGDITVGENSKVGAGSVVVKDVPPNATAVGIPGRIVIRDGKPVKDTGDTREQVDMPDPTATMIARLEARIRVLEENLARVRGEAPPRPTPSVLTDESLDASAL